jgi:predicted TIM-barrel fold metal-dependent hydrolase
MQITDAQVHLWPEDSAEHPWPEGAQQRAGAHPWALTSPAAVLAEMDAACVERAVLVPPTFAGGWNDVCLAAAAAHPDRFAVMGHFPLGAPDREAILARWLDTPGMLGLRVTLSRGASQAWLRDGTIDWLWAGAEQRGIPLYVLPPGLIAEMRQLALRHPRLKLVVDHLGLRTGACDAAVSEAVAELAQLADLPNVTVKADCLPSYVSEAYPFPGLQKVIRNVVDIFGPRRVFWGSDLSRLPCSYAEVVSLFTEHVDGLSAQDLEWIMGRGLSETLGWRR